jgi:3-oxoacyl-[acyl-carrier protein] reductase
VDLGLAGARAIVTGGSRGIGRAVVETLSAEGCSVCFCARGADGVAEAQEALRSRGAQVTGAAVDVGDPDAYRAWLGRALAQLGGLDILVCNATGYVLAGEDGWRNSLEIDMLGAVRAVETLAPALESSGIASIVSIASSTAVDLFLPGAEAYGALKAALIHYSGGLARSLGKQGVRCNVVSPGPIEFEGANNWAKRRDQGDPLYEMVRRQTPLGRLGTPHEVARAVVFLASPAASWVNGVNLLADGGLTTRVDY